MKGLETDKNIGKQGVLREAHVGGEKYCGVGVAQNQGLGKKNLKKKKERGQNKWGGWVVQKGKLPSDSQSHLRLWRSDESVRVKKESRENFAVQREHSLGK